IPRLEGLLGIGMLFPKEAKRFEGDNAHVDIIQCSRIGNNLRMERRTPGVTAPLTLAQSVRLLWDTQAAQSSSADADSIRELCHARVLWQAGYGVPRRVPAGSAADVPASWLNQVGLIGVYRHFESSERCLTPLENPINGFGHFR